MPVTEHGDRICRLAERAAGTDDAELALRTLTELRGTLDDLVQVHVGRALASGGSYGDIARALGISRQAAHRRYRALAPKPRRRRLRATPQARRVVRLARAETLASGAAAAGSRHVLLAVLRTDTDGARALQSEGITLARARACWQTIEANGRNDADPMCVRRILRNAVALSRGDGRLRPEQLLVAALADPDDGARRTVTALGTTPAAIAARLGWPAPCGDAIASSVVDGDAKAV